MRFSQAFLLAIAAACGGSNEAPAPLAVLRVAATTPSSGATRVGLDTEVRATFSVAMEASSVTSDSFRLQGTNGPLAGEIDYDAGTRTARFRPSEPLAHDVQYKAVLTTGCRAADGRQLESRVEWSFTTLDRSWTKPFDLGPGKALALQTTAAGKAYAIWTNGGLGFLATYRDGSWSAAELLPASQVADTALAEHGDGSLTAAIVTSDGSLVVSTRGTSGQWSPLETVATSGVTSTPQLATSASGHALVAWQADRTAYARARTPMRSWGPTQTLGNTVPRVWLGQDGGGYVAYAFLQRTGPEPPYVYRTSLERRCVDPAGSWTRCDPGLGANLAVLDFDMAPDANGYGPAAVSWKGMHVVEEFFTLETHRLEPAGWYRDPVEAFRLQEGPRFHPRIRRSAEGHVVLVWQAGPTRFERGITAVIGNGRGSYIDPVRLGPSADFVSTYAAAATRRGRAIVAWDLAGILASRYVPGRGWEEPTRLTNTSVDGLFAASRLGNTTLLWSARNRVFASHHE